MPDSNLIQRPTEIDAEILRFQNNYNKWVSFVGLINNKPYEIYTGQAEDFWVPQWVKKGKIVEVKSPENILRYDFQYEDRAEYKITIEGLSRAFDKEYRNRSKLFSLILQKEIPVDKVLDILKLIEVYDDKLINWKSGMQKTLEHFLEK